MPYRAEAGSVFVIGVSYGIHLPVMQHRYAGYQSAICLKK